MLFGVLLVPAFLVVIDIMLKTNNNETKTGLITSYYSFFIIVPWLSVSVRRLHDTNKSGWWILAPIGLSLIVFLVIENVVVGFSVYMILQFVVLNYFLALNSDAVENKYGDPPRGVKVKPKNINPIERTIDSKQQVVELSVNSESPSVDDDSEFYLQATEEIDNGKQHSALWAKVMTICEGDERKAKYKYITMRVKHLVEESPVISKEKMALAEEEYREALNKAATHIRENK